MTTPANGERARAAAYAYAAARHAHRVRVTSGGYVIEKWDGRAWVYVTEYPK